MDSRRSFFRQLIATGATLRQRPLSRNRLAHHVNSLLFRGPMTIPEGVADAVAVSAVYRTTQRKLVLRHVTPDGTVWLFRTAVPEHRCLIGEIVRCPDKRYRVHCWTIAEPGAYRDAAERITAQRAPLPTALLRSPAILAPMTRRVEPSPHDASYEEGVDAMTIQQVLD